MSNCITCGIEIRGNNLKHSNVGLDVDGLECIYCERNRYYHKANEKETVKEVAPTFHYKYKDLTSLDVCVDHKGKQWVFLAVVEGGLYEGIKLLGLDGASYTMTTGDIFKV